MLIYENEEESTTMSWLAQCTITVLISVRPPTPTTPTCFGHFRKHNDRCSASHYTYQNTIHSVRKNFTVLNRNSSPCGLV